MPAMDTWRGQKNSEGLRAFMGWGGLVVSDETVDVLDMLRAYYEAAAAESCGQCASGRCGKESIAHRTRLPRPHNRRAACRAHRQSHR